MLEKFSQQTFAQRGLDALPVILSGRNRRQRQRGNQRAKKQHQTGEYFDVLDINHGFVVCRLREQKLKK